MKIKRSELNQFDIMFDKCVVTLHKDLVSWKSAQQKVLKGHDFVHKFDFTEFAKESFLHVVRRFYDHHYAAEAALKEVRNIINDTDADLEEELA